jgi:type II secretory pathway component PulM
MNAFANIASLIESLWRRMTRREQLAVLLMVGAAIIFFIYIGLMRPLAAYQHEAARDLANAGERIARIERLLSQLEAGAPKQADTQQTPRVRIIEAARAEGISIEQIEPLNPGFRVAVSNVPAATLFDWLTIVENNKAVPVNTLSISKSSQGNALNADIRFGDGL